MRLPLNMFQHLLEESILDILRGGVSHQRFVADSPIQKGKNMSGK